MIKVTGCRVLVKPLNIEDLDPTYRRAKQAGLLLTDMDERKAKVHAEKGIILELGPKVNPDYVEGARVGDVIGFTKFGGKFVKDKPEDDELLVINDEDIICVFKETK